MCHIINWPALLCLSGIRPFQNHIYCSCHNSWKNVVRYMDDMCIYNMCACVCVCVDHSRMDVCECMCMCVQVLTIVGWMLFSPDLHLHQ